MIENSTSFQNMLLLFIKYVHLITISSKYRGTFIFFPGVYVKSVSLYCQDTLWIVKQYSVVSKASHIQLDECIAVTFSMFVVYDLRKSKSTNKSRSGKVMPNYRAYAIVELGHVFCLLSFVFYLFVLFFFIDFIPSASNASISNHTCVSFFSCSCNEHVLF